MIQEYEVLVPPLIAVVDASGVATTRGIGPEGLGEEYEIQRYSVSLSTGFGICRVYRNVISANGQIDYTDDGEGATSENNSIRIRTGEKIFFQWTGATVGATATANVFGIRRVQSYRSVT